MAKSESDHKNVSDLIWGADKIFYERYKQDDDLAPFDFAACYVRLGGEPHDIPQWVAEHFVRVAGEYQLAAEKDRRAGRHPKKSLGTFAGLHRRKLRQSHAEQSLREMFLFLFERHTERARTAIDAAGGSSHTRRDRDGVRVPIAGNEFVGDEFVGGDDPRCAIINSRGEVTKAFKIKLASQCGLITQSKSDDSLYGKAQEILKAANKPRYVEK